MNAQYVYRSAQVGEFRPALLSGTGPASYSQTTGDVVYNPGAQEYLIAPTDSTSQSGNYLVHFQPVTVGDVRAGAPNATTSGWVANWQYSGQASNGDIATSVAVTTAG